MKTNISPIINDPLSQPATRDVIRIRGSVDYLGARGEFTMMADCEGRFVREIFAATGDRAWFDGSSGQFVDWNGMPGPLEMYSRHWLQIQASFFAGTWRNTTSAYRIGEPGRDTDGNLSVSIAHLDGPLDVTVVMDESGESARKLSYEGIRGLEEITFQGYRVLGDVIVSTRIEHTIGGVVNATYEVASAERVIEGSESFTRSWRIPDDFVFDPAIPGELEVRRASTGQILVRPRLNGSDPGWFIFDSGGGVSIVSPEVATALELPEEGAIPVTSVWGTTNTPFRRLHRLQLGPLTINDLLVAQMDMSFLEPHFGVPVKGLIGFDVLSRAVAQFETARDRVTLFDPRTYESAHPWQPLTIHAQHPVVHTRFDRGEGQFRLDTGAAGGPGGNVMFTAAAVNDFDLLSGRETTEAAVGSGKVAVGFIDWFELAGHRFEEPTAIFHLDAQGPGGDRYLTGNIGVTFMDPFRITFDYSRTRISLELL